MGLIALGINHKTAPVEVREKLALSADQSRGLLERLCARFEGVEFTVLSTCNRVELYGFGSQEENPAPSALAETLAAFHGVESSLFDSSLYTHRDRDAVEHLFTVASSLDSMVVGEPQIAGQVKDSYSLAVEAGATGKVLNRLFHAALNTSKEVFSSTSIAQGRVSVAGVAVELARQLFADMKKARVVIIGAGEMGQLLIRHLLDLGNKRVTVVNRSFDRAQRIAEDYGIEAGEWELLPTQMALADMVVAAAQTDKPLFGREFCREALHHRKRGPLLIVDIAVPRNFAPEVNDLKEVYLYGVDDLAQVVETNLQARHDEMEKARGIVLENVVEFMDWLALKDLGPLLGQMRQQFQDISKGELECFFTGANGLSDENRARICKMVHRLVNRQTHVLIERFNDLARKESPQEVQRLLSTIFAPMKDDEETRRSEGR